MQIDETFLPYDPLNQVSTQIPKSFRAPKAVTHVINLPLTIGPTHIQKLRNSSEFKRRLERLSRTGGSISIDEEESLILLIGKEKSLLKFKKWLDIWIEETCLYVQHTRSSSPPSVLTPPVSPVSAPSPVILVEPPSPPSSPSNPITTMTVENSPSLRPISSQRRKPTSNNRKRVSLQIIPSVEQTYRIDSPPNALNNRPLPTPPTSPSVSNTTSSRRKRASSVPFITPDQTFVQEHSLRSPTSPTQRMYNRSASYTVSNLYEQPTQMLQPQPLISYVAGRPIRTTDGLSYNRSPSHYPFSSNSYSSFATRRQSFPTNVIYASQSQYNTIPSPSVSSKRRESRRMSTVSNQFVWDDDKESASSGNASVRAKNDNHKRRSRKHSSAGLNSPTSSIFSSEGSNGSSSTVSNSTSETEVIHRYRDDTKKRKEKQIVKDVRPLSPASVRTDGSNSSAEKKSKGVKKFFAKLFS
ncbi:hypothetical protein BKA69DRAFT_1042072 [Paraphysoderma sedebokerense]|nr:hypothetical protein BKA69DRAFT_1042072 [Paraphysoderma sedebokerense]